MSPESPNDPEREGRLRAATWQERVIQYTIEGVIRLDSRLRVTDMNTSARRLFRCELKDVAGTSYRRFIPARFRRLHLRHVRDFKRSGKPSIEMSARPTVCALRFDGEEFDAEITIVRLDSSGDPSFACIVRDVSARRQAEARLRFHAELLERVEAAAVAVDDDGKIVYWNRAAEQLYGWHPDEVLGRELSSFPVFDQPDALVQATATLRDQASWEGDLHLVSNDGVPHEVHAVASRVLDPDGRPIGVVTISFDVTERKRAEEALIQSQKLESLGVLAGGIAHDFNNILTTVIGNAHLALRLLEPEGELGTLLVDIRSAALRAGELAQQLLTFAGKGNVTIQPVEVNQLTDELLHLLLVSVGPHIDLRTHFQSSLPLISADPTQLRQVIMNLVLNAADAVGKTHGRISVSTTLVEADRRLWRGAQLIPAAPAGQFLCVEVSDSGAGMDAETVERIFEPFFTTKFTGRGLGLAAVFGIVRGHEGGIKVRSRIGRGSTFRIYLPASSGDEHHTIPRQSHAPA